LNTSEKKSTFNLFKHIYEYDLFFLTYLSDIKPEKNEREKLQSRVLSHLFHEGSSSPRIFLQSTVKAFFKQNMKY